MLTVHHLGVSQSERIVWLCEELGLDYELKLYARRTDNRLAPDEYKALHPMGIAPVITDGPFPEAKELLAGYRVLDVETAERAIEVAATASAAPGPDGAPIRQPIEVREVLSAPDPEL